MASQDNPEPRNQRATSSAKSIEDSFFDYLMKNCREDLQKILESPDENGHFRIMIQYVELNIGCKNICTPLLENPEKVLLEGDKAGCRAVRQVYDESSNKQGLVPKRFVHIRIHSMPACWNRYMTSFPTTKDIGKFVTILGTVVKTKSAALLEFSKEYQCNKCNTAIFVEAPATRFHAFPKYVDKCPKECDGAKLEPRKAKSDDATDTSNRFRDYQEIKLLEHSTLVDDQPKSLWVVLENDLVDTCQCGDDVVVTGYIYIRWQPFRANVQMKLFFTFLANHITVNNDQKSSIVYTDETIKSFREFWEHHENNPFVARNLIIKSFCPRICGMYLVKLAAAVVLVGGVSKEKSGSKTRGESHLLLVGDPGTGKSILLKYISNMCPRSLMTTGAGSTHAGLTVSAVNEGGNWHLEAGALVLADGGVCCIDEFANLKEHEQTCFNEAMEQQTISVAKGGIVCTLKTKCTIIAACNPKQKKYNNSETLAYNIGLPSPLLSRFDLIYILIDAENDKWDELLCDSVLEAAMNPIGTKPKETYPGSWDCDQLKSYLMLVKAKTPQMTDDALSVINEYYGRQRNSIDRNAARTTARMFESLVRIAEGHAKLMSRDFVIIHDAITSILLFEVSMQHFAILNVPNSLHINFPEDDLKEYYDQAKQVLEILGLPQMWAIEKTYLENFMLRLFNVNQTTQSTHSQASASQQESRMNTGRSRQTFQTQSSVQDSATNVFNDEIFSAEIHDFFYDSDTDKVSESTSPDMPSEHG